MNSAPACIILEQLGARGAEPGGGRGGGRAEKAATLPALERICCGGRGVAGLEEEKLQLLSPQFYARWIFFSYLPLHAASRRHIILAETFAQTPRRA